MAPESFAGFPKETLGFLSRLSSHNEKAWFDAHRDDYQRYYLAPAQAFVVALGEKLRRLAPGVHAEPRISGAGGGSIMRINRDIRFSKDKSPYKDHLDLWLWDGPEKGWECSGFWFRLQPNRLMLGAGLYHFEKDALERYRKAVVDPKKGARLVKAVAAVRKAGYEVGGAEYKKPPRGFSAEGPRAPLLLHAGLYAGFDARPPKELHTAKFVDFCVGHYRKVLPVHAWLQQDLVGR